MSSYRRGMWRIVFEGDTGGYEKLIVFIVNTIEVRMIFIAKGLEIWQARGLYNTLCQVVDSTMLAPLSDEEFKVLAKEEEARCRKNVYGI